jgi:hypothetical protein
MPDEQHEYSTLVLQVDLPTRFIQHLELHLHGMLDAGQIDGFYMLTKNRAPIHHEDEHLNAENRLGRAISTIQNDKVLLHSLGDTH